MTLFGRLGLMLILFCSSFIFSCTSTSEPELFNSGLSAIIEGSGKIYYFDTASSPQGERVLNLSKANVRPLYLDLYSCHDMAKFRRVSKLANIKCIFLPRMFLRTHTSELHDLFPGVAFSVNLDDSRL